MNGKIEWVPIKIEVTKLDCECGWHGLPDETMQVTNNPISKLLVFCPICNKLLWWAD